VNSFDLNDFFGAKKMQVLMNVVLVVQILAAMAMIGLVLIQHGKGADMGASFGSGSAGSLFGASGSANFLSRSTAVAAAVFFSCTLGLAYFANDRNGNLPAQGSSVLDRAAASAPAASAVTTGAAQIPVSASAVVVTPSAPVASAAVSPEPKVFVPAVKAASAGASAVK
jgi:preprotein translocase subunit SecG